MRQGRKIGEKDLCDCWSGWRVGGRSRMFASELGIRLGEEEKEVKICS